MIESNRVSVAGQLLPAPVPERLSSELLLGSRGGGSLRPPSKLGTRPAPAQPSKHPYYCIDHSEMLQRWEVFTASSSPRARICQG